jgi:hypothetical protein
MGGRVIVGAADNGGELHHSPGSRPGELTAGRQDWGATGALAPLAAIAAVEDAAGACPLLPSLADLGGPVVLPAPRVE